MMRVKIENLSVNVKISDLISTAAAAAGALILNSEANFHFLLDEQKMQERFTYSRTQTPTFKSTPACASATSA